MNTDAATVAKRKEAHAAARNQDVELWISNALRGGVLVSAAVIVAGLLLFLVTGSTGYPPGASPRGLREIWDGLGRLAPYAVIDLGLLLLIATQVFQVGAASVAFAIERDRTYVAISGFVFCVLLVSFLLGRVQ